MSSQIRQKCPIRVDRNVRPDRTQLANQIGHNWVLYIDKIVTLQKNKTRRQFRRLCLIGFHLKTGTAS
jgi:hypothetical protein